MIHAFMGFFLLTIWWLAGKALIAGAKWLWNSLTPEQQPPKESKPVTREQTYNERKARIQADAAALRGFPGSIEEPIVKARPKMIPPSAETKPAPIRANTTSAGPRPKVDPFYVAKLEAYVEPGPRRDGWGIVVTNVIATDPPYTGPVFGTDLLLYRHVFGLLPDECAALRFDGRAFHLDNATLPLREVEKIVVGKPLKTRVSTTDVPHQIRYKHERVDGSMDLRYSDNPPWYHSERTTIVFHPQGIPHGVYTHPRLATITFLTDVANKLNSVFVAARVHDLESYVQRFDELLTNKIAPLDRELLPMTTSCKEFQEAIKQLEAVKKAGYTLSDQDETNLGILRREVEVLEGKTEEKQEQKFRVIEQMMTIGGELSAAVKAHEAGAQAQAAILRAQKLTATRTHADNNPS